jgi:hypothetical protein
VEQELLILSEHLSSLPLFNGVRVTRSLLLCVCFVDRCLSFCPFPFDHFVVCPSIYGFWLPFGIFWPFCCLSFDLRILIILWYLLAILLSVLRFTDSDYHLVSFGHFVVCPSIYGFWLPFGIFWPFCCLSFDLRILIILWYLLAILLSVLRFTDSDYPLVSFGHFVVCPSIYGFWLPFGIFWPFCCLSFNIRILITPLVSFDHCVVCSSSMYGFWLPLWYLLTIVLSVLLRCMDSDYPFGIFILFILINCNANSKQLDIYNSSLYNYPVKIDEIFIFVIDYLHLIFPNQLEIKRYYWHSNLVIRYQWGN